MSNSGGSGGASPPIDLFHLNVSLERLKQIHDEGTYSCKRCGICCRDGEEVFVSKKEAKTIAKRLKISFSRFKRKYHLIPTNGKGHWDIPAQPCPFLEGKNTCTIRSIRPQACKDFPFGRMYHMAKNMRRIELCPYCGAAQEMFAKENAVSDYG